MEAWLEAPKIQEILGGLKKFLGLTPASLNILRNFGAYC